MPALEGSATIPLRGNFLVINPKVMSFRLHDDGERINFPSNGLLLTLPWRLFCSEERTKRCTREENVSGYRNEVLRDIPQNLLTFRCSHESSPGNAHRTFALIAFRLPFNSGDVDANTAACCSSAFLCERRIGKTKLFLSSANTNTERGRCGSKFFTRITSKLSLRRCASSSTLHLSGDSVRDRN